jgi:ketosteroid isomerase-like protein
MQKPSCIIAMLSAATMLVFSLNTFADSKESKAVQSSVTEFYIALNQLFTGEMTAMEKIWSHSKDITYMGPDGAYDIGWEATRANFQVQANKKLGGKVMPKDIHTIIGNDLAIVSNYEVGENVNTQGKTEKVQIRVTSTFRKEKAGWKMIGHHTDTLSYLKK